MKSFAIGSIIAILATIITWLVWGIDSIPAVTGFIGALFIGGIIILSGSAGSGDRIRANYTTESSRDREERIMAMQQAFFLGLPSMIIAFLFKYVFLF